MLKGGPALAGWPLTSTRASRHVLFLPPNREGVMPFFLIGEMRAGERVQQVRTLAI